MPEATTASGVTRQQRKRKRVTRTITRAALLLVVVGLALAGFSLYQAMKTRDALNDASRHFNDLTAAVAIGDNVAAQESLYDAQLATLTAQRNTSGPAWWLASRAPVIGDDVNAVRTITDVVDNVSQGVLPTLVDASTSFSASDLQPSNGVIQLDRIAGVAPLLVDAHESLGADLSVVQSLQPEGLMAEIAGPVRELEAKLLDVTSVTDRASKAAELLPPMLGAEGERTYLVLFQNNAEIRATGGIPGSVATLTADNGALSLKSEGTASVLGTYDEPIVDLTREESALFTDRLGVFPADITFTPDFPRTAELAQAMWERQTDVSVDGVLATDPVALSYLLEGTGPIAIPGGEALTPETATKRLLSDIYLNEPDPQAQDAFFAGTAESVFRAVMSGGGDPRTVLDGIVRSADERRTLVWSDHSVEQAVLETTSLAGQLPEQSTGAPQVGVYLNDGTGSKMDYYLDYDVAVASTACHLDQSQQLRLTVTMASSAPSNAAELPVSVRGPGFGAPAGSIRTNLLVYAPGGGRVTSPSIDGRPAISASFVHEGRPVAAQTVDLKPGQSRSFTLTMRTGDNQPEQAVVQVTPGVNDSGQTQVSESACS